ncbi:hypothetical protein ABIB57_003656 [Devosia sp. UYZn731]|uniref:KilA-N domain-containing protein n=1 Tax=Devosia sp. UYZn731 TaxID=3156345 RepID=UPI0033982FA3
MTSQALTYQGQTIREKAEMLSLTDMWKAAGGDPQQTPAKWRDLPSSKTFIEHVEITIGKSDTALIKAQVGGKAPGTWAHWQIGLAYAKYLSPEFHMWCNDVVRAHMEGRDAAVSPGSALLHIETALARLHEVTESKVGGLHGHLKTQVTTPLSDLDAYLQEKLWNQFLREKRIIHTVDHLAARQDELIRVSTDIIRALQAANANDVFVPSHWADMKRVHRIANIPSNVAEQRALNALVGRSLDDFCCETDRWGDSSRDPFGRRCRIWRKTAVAAWLKDRGRALIDQHLAKHSSQTVIQFPGTAGEGGAK